MRREWLPLLVPLALIVAYATCGDEDEPTRTPELEPSAPQQARLQQFDVDAATAIAGSLQRATKLYLEQTDVTCPPGLVTLANRGWVRRSMLADPWGHAYSVVCHVTDGEAWVEVRSPGLDGKPGSADDISSADVR